MTDRELLELAAKAAGVEYMRGEQPHFNYPDMLTLDTADRFWRPLTDDGDALRLAVRLKMEIIPDPEGDEFASTRRNIVRAAASCIGATRVCEERHDEFSENRSTGAEDMSDGKDCTCAAWSENECACGADWTPLEVITLRARVAELEVDAARLEWLIQEYRVMSLNIDGNHAWVSNFRGNLKGPTMRDAIDAAMGEA